MAAAEGLFLSADLGGLSLGLGGGIKCGVYAAIRQIVNAEGLHLRPRARVRLAAAAVVRSGLSQGSHQH